LIKSWLAAGHEVIAAAPEEEVAEQLAAWLVPFERIPLNRTGMNPIKDLILLYHIRKIVKLHKPTYLFLYTVKPVIYGSLATWGNTGCRCYSMITGLGYVFTEASGSSRLLRYIVEQLYRMALKRNERIFFQNPDDYALFVRKNLVSKKKSLLINGSGINLDYYQIADLPEKKYIFLMIARLLIEKGVREYIQAAGLVKQKYPEAQFILVGWAFSDNQSSISETDVERWKNEGVVDILSELEDVRPIIASSSVYVLPSYREGTPRTVLEAMAMGRPIITSDAPGCRETVEDGVNGFLVPVRDVDSLAEAMERFIREPELLAKLGAESRRIAEEKYDVHKVNKAINRAMGLKYVIA
ncbi:MAG: glycosyltransferase family 4 protein, partial [Thermodesulfovibrionia bacterium]|nr:glycosyltransferase family 4 protein [Thermodesulfovibrionia bacterium]